MRKRSQVVLFLFLISSVGLSAAGGEPAAFYADLDGGSYLIIPEASALVSISFPLGPGGLRIAGQAGFSYLFDVWDDIHAGSIYFPLGVELSYTPWGLGVSARYYLSLTDTVGEGIFEVLARAYLDLVRQPRFHFVFIFSLGISAFLDYEETLPVFPVTAKIGFRFRFPFRGPLE